ncbi:4-hydroxy-tetrahydrodipicolinate synthase [Dyadobacter sp. CECT 9275]|uniref:4-hydroxy-tetrahydrodipicolinate synthase n=1 Tax=Dyadobacter helix TaxID=2822344 RepID=A0A916JBM0_9BACT|nr:dihydrodipicolinate synthase family protein [Dyadobacter sp. CECT 9275]CAG5002320.1 4-hydroxy-tetrahydrodipicolinate synthase [Dyadobacter sp. CECT 9275]
MKKDTQLSRRAFLEKVPPVTLSLLAAGQLMAPVRAESASSSAGQPHYYGGDIHPADLKKFVPVMVTPLDSNKKIDYDKVSLLVDFYLAAGARGFFANCLSSEMFFMDDAERIALTRHVVKYVNGRVPVVSTGSFGNSMKEKVAFARKINDTGVDAAILITSHFAEKDESDQKLINNFEEFFEKTGDIRLGTYECPRPYKRIITPKVFKFLVSNDRLIYHKDTSEDIANIAAKLEIARGTKMELYNAHSATVLKALQLGARGMSPVSGNFYPEIHTWLCENVNNPAKSADAEWIQSEIAKMEPVIGKYYPLSSKYFLRKRGFPIEVISRSNSREIPADQAQILDNSYKTFLSWCDRLRIKPATV